MKDCESYRVSLSSLMRVKRGQKKKQRKKRKRKKKPAFLSPSGVDLVLLSGQTGCLLRIYICRAESGQYGLLITHCSAQLTAPFMPPIWNHMLHHGMGVASWDCGEGGQSAQVVRGNSGLNQRASQNVLQSRSSTRLVCGSRFLKITSKNDFIHFNLY